MVVRWGLPESPRWLASRGRFAQADRIVSSLETDAALQRVQVTRREPVVEPLAVNASSRMRTLWAPEFRLRTLSVWAVWFCVNFAYYGAFIWIPSILVAAGYDLVRSFGFTLLITLAQLPGYAVAAWLIEAWGRRITLSVFLAGSAVSAVLFGVADSETAIIAAGMALSFFNLGAWGALYAVTPEIYPTSLRATGAGWAAGVGRIASIIAPLLVPVLLARGGAPLAFIVFSVFFVIATVAAWGLVDRRGKALDDR
jgi:putative MFS transporter